MTNDLNKINTVEFLTMHMEEGKLYKLSLSGIERVGYLKGKDLISIRFCKVKNEVVFERVIFSPISSIGEIKEIQMTRIEYIQFLVDKNIKAELEKL